MQRLKPEVVFCVPVQLLEIDFHNIEIGLSYLGIELPVSVSCLERYEDERLLKYKQSWEERWNVLENFCNEPCSSHLVNYDETVVDITCPKQLHRWLLRQDETRRRPIAGMGFYATYSRLTEVFLNFLMNGLPIVFWPSRSLEIAEIERLRESLNEAPSRVLAAVRSYRVGGEADDAGPVSILFDNPYLCPPDCEIDYY